jgi:tetratricopeptide (TPR) repeat protein
MGHILVGKLLPVLDKMTWPESPELTELGREAFEIGLETVDQYTGDPNDLASALRKFRSGDSKPYALAGAAYTLIAAAKEQDGSYADSGLEAALDWLEQAQQLVPDAVEINFMEGLIYIYSGRFSDARTVLDYLKEIAPAEYHVLNAEALYWEQLREIDETVYWYERAIGSAETVPQKLRLRRRLGDAYLRFGMNTKALEVYEEAVHFDKENALLWHRMSMAYWNLGEYEEASRCNKRALKIRSFPEAEEMQAALADKIDSGGIARRLFGRRSSES